MTGRRRVPPALVPRVHRSLPPAPPRAYLGGYPQVSPLVNPLVNPQVNPQVYLQVCVTSRSVARSYRQ